MTPKERELEKRVALMELERAWEKERETYLVYGSRGGRGREPMDSTGTCAFAAILWVGIVVAPLFTEYTILSGIAFFLGLLFLLPPILSGISETRRYKAFTQAEARYKERRTALLSGNRAAEAAR